MKTILLIMFVNLFCIDLNHKVSDEMKFIIQHRELAQKVEYLYCIPSYLCMAQCILESHYGKSTLAQEANNYFGIKWWPNCGQEFHVLHKGKAKWRCYPSVKQSFYDYGYFFESLKIKIPNHDRNDYLFWCRWIKAKKYAGPDNHQYERDLIDIIKQYNLLENV